MFYAAVIILLALNQVFSITIPPPDSNCDFEWKVKRSKFVEIKSPGWPKYYKKNKVCRWIIDCPIRFICHLRCHDVLIPETAKCTADQLLVSTQGSNWLVGADKYCGTKIIDVESENYRITIGFISTSITPGGRFRCQVAPELKTDTGPSTDFVLY